MVTRVDCFMLVMGKLLEAREVPMTGKDQRPSSHPEPRAAQGPEGDIHPRASRKMAAVGAQTQVRKVHLQKDP